MPSFFTRNGDNGKTGLLGEGRISKAHLRIETLGSIDEATSALGFARAISKNPRINELILLIQRDLYDLMTEIAATPENNQKFQILKEDRVIWLESQIEVFSKNTRIPKDFILPGDTIPGAAFSLARTIVRRAERRMAEMMDLGFVNNHLPLKYLNRLSSFCFIIELFEIQSTGKSSTLAKGNTKD